MSSAVCPSCGRGVLTPRPSKRPILIVKDNVTQGEIEFSTIFGLTGISPFGNQENSASYYLQKEFGMAGLNMESFAMTCLHLHTPPKAKKTKADREIVQGCVDFGTKQLVEFIQPYKLILTLGSEVTKFLTGYNASTVYGLVCQSQFTPAVVVPAPNSDKIMAQPIGELRNALKVFAEQVKILDQYLNI